MYLWYFLLVQAYIGYINGHNKVLIQVCYEVSLSTDFFDIGSDASDLCKPKQFRKLRFINFKINFMKLL